MLLAGHNQYGETLHSALQTEPDRASRLASRQSRPHPSPGIREKQFLDFLCSENVGCVMTYASKFYKRVPGVQPGHFRERAHVARSVQDPHG